MTCERRLNKQVCGGDGLEVSSISGEIVWGWECQRCKKFSERCQSCGKQFASLALHIRAKPGCRDANQVSATHAAVKRIFG